MFLPLNFQRAFFVVWSEVSRGILIGPDAYQIDKLQRLRPGTYWKTLSRKLKCELSMF